jgi:hypothetical protein
MKLMRGMALAIVFSVVGAQMAAAIEISESTYANYQKYLKTIGSTKKGAFAVSTDGFNSFFSYCTDPSCIATSLSQQAVSECQSLTGMECLLMAYGREVRIEYTVVPKRATLSEGDAILAHVLDADRLKKLLVGNTMQGEYIHHKKWMEYYAADGTLRGKADSFGTLRGHYEFKDNAICYHYQGHSDWDWCAQVSVHNDTIRFLEDGKLVTGQTNVEWLQGNPHNL